MKFNIDWHKDCYKNSEGSLKRKQQQCDMLDAEIDKAAKRLMLYAMQINLAEKEGKHSFDSEKYALGRLHVNEPIDLTIDIMKKGDFFGWSSFAEPYKYTASAYAVGDTELIQFRADEMKKLCEVSDHIGHILMNNITTIVSERFYRLEGLLKHVIQTGVEKP